MKFSCVSYLTAAGFPSTTVAMMQRPMRKVMKSARFMLIVDLVVFRSCYTAN